MIDFFMQAPVEFPGGDMFGLEAAVEAIAGAFAVFGLLFLVIWIYQGFAWMKIAEKTKTSNGWLAFVPVGNMVLLANIAKMHWWPVLLLLAMIIPFLNFVAFVVLLVFMYIWMWKSFERVGRPGWWPLLGLIPAVGTIIYLILLGIAAWGKK